MTPSSPKERVRLLDRSLRCFVFGMLSLIPVLGLPMSILAWWHGHVASRQSKGQWNPARHYVLWGRALAWLGCLVTFVLFPLLLLAIANADLAGLSCSGFT